LFYHHQEQYISLGYRRWIISLFSSPFLRLFPAIYHIQIVENFENKSGSGGSPSDDPADGDIELVREAKNNVPEPLDYSYSERDVILYNLSIGATEQELHWSFENHEEFAALPTFGVIPQFMTSSGLSLDFLPNFNPVRTLLTSGQRVRRPDVPVIAYLHRLTHYPPNLKAKLLHGEQFLAIKAPIPTGGDLVNEARYVRAFPWFSFHYEGPLLRMWAYTEVYRIIEVLDKGKAAAVTMQVTTKDKNTGTIIFENQSTVFIRGSGGFGGQRVGKGTSTRTPKRCCGKFARLNFFSFRFPGIFFG